MPGYRVWRETRHCVVNRSRSRTIFGINALKDWENERRPGLNTIQNRAKTTRKQKENMIYKTWSNWWETVPSHLAVFENPLSTSCILSAKSWVCDGLRWKPSAIPGCFISISPDKQMDFIFSQWPTFQWLTNQCHNKTGLGQFNCVITVVLAAGISAIQLHEQH